MMIKHLKSGKKKSGLHQSVFSVLEKKIISGNMEQDLVDHVLKFTMTVEKNTDVVNLIVL